MTEVVVIDGGVDVVVSEQNDVVLSESLELVIIEGSTEIVTMPATDIVVIASDSELAVIDNTEVVILDAETIEVVEIGIQGPPGPSGYSYITLTAGIALGGHRAVVDSAAYADNTNDAHLARVIGLTTGAAEAGAPVSVQSSGELNGFSGLTPGPVYLSVNGTITQTLPTTGFIQQLGNAVSSSSILINILPPVKLI